MAGPGDNFTIYPATKVIRHTSGTTVYSVQEFYSWLMDTFDEPGYMTYATPMKYNTPTSYTMLNGWFLDNGDESNALQYLTGGGIDSSGYTGDVLVLDLDATTDCLLADKDKTVTDDAANVGPLLAYKNDFPVSGSARWWIRDTYSHGAIADPSVMDIPTGTGAGAANGASASGDDIYANLYTIASFPGSPNPQVYIFQSGERIVEWSGLTNWDRGSIDVLIEVRRAGSLISSGLVSVFVRQSGDLFTATPDVDLSAGGRNPVAVETTADINETTGEHYLLYDAEAAGGFAIGNVIDNGPAAGVPPSFYAEVLTVTDWGASGLLKLRGLRGTIADNAALFVGGVQKGLANGTPGDTYTTYSAAGTQLTVGNICTGGTSGAKRILRGIQDDTGTGKYVFQVSTTVTGVNRKPYYKAFTLGETITDEGTGTVTCGVASTTIVSGFTDITIGCVNGTVDVGTFSGAFIIGERVTWDAGASSAILVKTDGATSMTLANVTSPETLNTKTITGDLSTKTCVASDNLANANTATFAFTQQTAFPYSVFVQGGSIYSATGTVGRDLDEIFQYLKYVCRDASTFQFYTSDGATITALDGQEFIKAVAAYTATKAAPLGTLAGGVFFGAQGVWVQGMLPADANNVKLTDHNAQPRQPYASVVVSVTNLVAGDSVAVYKKHATLSQPEKDTYTSHNTNNAQGDPTFERDAVDFPIDTPDGGTFIVVQGAEEHRYRYTEWAGTVLTLPTKRTSAATAGSTGQKLIDSNAFFQTWGIQRGDIIRNTTDGGWGYVTQIDSEIQLWTTQLTTAGKDWAPGDGYFLNALVVTYTNVDKFFIPYVDAEAAGASVSVTVLYNGATDTWIVVRDNASTPPIQPFQTASAIGSGGMSVAAIRNEDEVTL